MSRYSRYPAYKDSGVEWLGDVPDYWKVLSLKRITSLAYGEALASEIRKDGPFDVFGSNGPVGQHNHANMLAPAIVIGRKGSYGKITFAKDGGFCIDTAFFIDKLSSEHSLKWLFWLLQTLNLDTCSEDTGVPGLSREYAYNLPTVCPPESDQNTIAAFLDRETARIDALIAKKTRFIVLLKEKRQALITHAVTKGLNPNVKMKDSGVEWLGEVPEHWEISRLKYLTTHIGSGKTPSGGAEIYQNEGIVFLRSQNIHDHGLTLDDVVYISEEIDNTMKNSRVFSGDVLLNITGASIGRSCLVPVDMKSANVNQHVCILRTQQSKNPIWISRCLISSMVKNQIKYFQNGAGREGLNFEQIGNILITFPSQSEQTEIIHFLDRETSRIDALISKTERSIELLKERRSALITAAVTGQIDVRETA